MNLSKEKKKWLRKPQHQQPEELWQEPESIAPLTARQLHKHQALVLALNLGVRKDTLPDAMFLHPWRAALRGCMPQHFPGGPCNPMS